MNLKLIFILVIISLILIFWVGSLYGQEEVTNADRFEIYLTPEQDAIISGVTWRYEWDGCWQGTSTCQEVRMSASVK